MIASLVYAPEVLAQKRVKLKQAVRNSLVLTLEAYGDFSAATLPTMTIQVGIGDDMFFTKGAFTPRKYGWYWSF